LQAGVADVLGRDALEAAVFEDALGVTFELGLQLLVAEQVEQEVDHVLHAGHGGLLTGGIRVA